MTQPEPVLRRHAEHDPALICRPALGFGLCELASCRIDWRAFDLEPPDADESPSCPVPGQCRCPAVYRLIQGCAHEHVHQALACGHCLDYMRTLEPFEKWACAACLRGSDGHQCRAPVIVQPSGVVPSETAATGGKRDG